jgi:hypothetical protein
MTNTYTQVFGGTTIYPSGCLLPVPDALRRHQP